MNNINIYIYIFRLLILFNILWGAHAWFTWSIKSSNILLFLVYILQVLISLMYKNNVKIKLLFNFNIVFSFLFYVLGILFICEFNIIPVFGYLLVLFPLWVLISDRINVVGHLRFVCNSLAYMLIPGIFIYVFLKFYEIPSLVISHPNTERYLFYNYFFYIKDIFSTDIVNSRFNSIFLESGYSGTLLAFLLYSIKYDFSRWENKVLLISMILSFSLAAYILTIVGYSINILSKNDNKIKKIIMFFVFGILVYSVAQIYNDGKNYINEKIIERLQFDDEKGITGNNRTGAGADFYYKKSIDDGTIWFGLGVSEINRINGGLASSASYDTNIRGAGYKIYFLTYGIIVSCFMLLFYYYMAKGICYNNKILRTGFVIICILTFLQASYPLSFAWLYPFILGLNNFKISEK